jgi:hypothetical protein
MNRTIRDLSVASALIAAVYQPLDACGDKLLLVGRGLKFQRAYASLNPGHVLVYARATLSANAAIRNPQLHRTLRQAGHSVSVIEDAGLLEQALRSTTVDVVLTDVNEADRVSSSLAAASATPPEVLFVAYPAANGSSSPPAVVCKLKPSDRALKYLDAIEDAMKVRAAARRPRTS